MREEYNKFLEENIADQNRQIKEKGYAERNNERFYDIKTPYGNVFFVTVSKRQRRLFKNMAVLHMLKSSNIDINTEDFEWFLYNPKSGEIIDKWLEENIDPNEIRRIDEISDRAYNYFFEHLQEMFVVTVNSYFDESFIHGLIKMTAAEEDREPPATEVDIFNGFVKFVNASLKTRLGIQKASGRKSKRTKEDLYQMGAFYDLSLPLVQEAKKSYTSNKRKQGWVDAVKALHSDVPINIIEKFAQKGLSPSELTLSWVAEKFGTEPTEYLRKELIKIRKAATVKTSAKEETCEAHFD